MRFSTASSLVVILVAFIIASSVDGIPFRAAYKTKSPSSKTQSVKGYLDKLSREYIQMIRKLLANRYAAESKRSSIMSGTVAERGVGELTRREIDEFIRFFEEP